MSAALLEPISYAAVGPLFGTATKATGYEPVGLGGLDEATAFFDRVRGGAAAGVR